VIGKRCFVGAARGLEVHDATQYATTYAKNPAPNRATTPAQVMTARVRNISMRRLT
jgi:hypothetical protein